MTDAPPVVVIGAGIVGVSTALWLQRDGFDVLLVDRAGPAGGTSYGNGGVLASCAVVPVTVPGLMRQAPRMLLDRNAPLYLRWSYLPRLMPWLRSYLAHCTPSEVRRIAAGLLPIIGDSLADHQALSHGTGAERWLVPCDYVYAYRDRAHYAADAFGWAVRRDLGVVWDEIEGAAFAAYAPAFAGRLGFGARFAGHGRITDPGRYVADLAADFARRGGRIVRGEVTDFVTADGRLSGVRAGGETLPCTRAVVATGAWSKPLCARLGLDVPLESERGYHVELWDPSVTLDAAFMIAAGRFVATPMDGRLRLAGIIEFGGLEAGPSRAPFEMLTRSIRAAIPGLRWSRRTEWMGHRPATADSLPVIGEASGVPGVYLGFGHHHVGLTGGPRTGRILAQLVAGRTPNLDLAPYAPSRFQ